MIIDIAFWLFILASVVQLLLWGGVFRSLVFYREPDCQIAEEKPVSIVICAWNEAENLRKNLPFWLSQDYPDFEVLIVDDGSVDETAAVVKEVAGKNTRLRYVRLDRLQHQAVGKKEALATGIKAAKNELLLLTDADCKPASSEWLSLMSGPLRQSANLVLGFSPFERKKGILNKWIRYEGFYTACLYFSATLWGETYMGVGRNIAYPKALFFQAGGFEEHKDLGGGDDDLFVKSLFDSSLRPVMAKETVVMSVAESWTVSSAKSSWPTYFRQKQRHLSTGIRYRFRTKMLLGVIAASHFFHFVLGFIGLWLFPVWAFVGLFLRLVIFSWRSKRLLNRFGENDLFPFIPFLDLFFIAYYLIFSPIIFGIRTVEKW